MKVNMNNNNKKQEQLGMPIGTAQNRLRKMVLFNLLQKYEDDICYRCDEKIETITELSLEHKVAWLDNSAELFWDLDNIAFSHLSCNIKSGRSNKIISPNGKLWCWKCKQLKDENLFPPYSKVKLNGCTGCNTKYTLMNRKRKKVL